jgi:lipoyl(octanoyl) transferase
VWRMARRSTSEAQGPAKAPRPETGVPRISGARPPVWVVSYAEPQAYAFMWELQRRLLRQRVAGAIPDTLLLLEHHPVVTLGKNARREHVLREEADLLGRGVELAETDRGGDVTYHGPGQLVGYWIFDLRALYQDVHRFLREIEEVIIRVLRLHGIEAGRDPRATGVWVDGEKIAALGLHLSHWVSTHGFAFNLAPDLSPFGWIVPCGLHGRGVTSLAQLLGARGEDPPSRAAVEAELVAEVAGIFQRSPLALSPLELDDCLMSLERTAAAAEGGGRAVSGQRT